VNNHIDIIEIQETKMKEFSDRILHKLSLSINFWLFKYALGNSGGLLLGVNDSLFDILNKWILEYSITVCVQDKGD
jgi:hypothetical protein